MADTLLIHDLELNCIDFKKRLWLWWMHGYNNNLKGKLSFGARSTTLEALVKSKKDV